MMTTHDKLPILNISATEVAPLALVVGDPARAAQAAALLDEARQIGSNREYDTYVGQRAGQAITVCSHGVGSPGAALCFEELARAGVKGIIRAGTCGALQDGIADGDLVIAAGAVRNEGLTTRLVPSGYPALAHYRLIAMLEAEAERAGVPFHTGIVLTEDVFYPSEALPPAWTVWQKSHVAAVEMELAALFIIAALHRIPAGGILTVDGNPTRAAADMSDYDPHRSVVTAGKIKMLEVALTALVHFGESA